MKRELQVGCTVRSKVSTAGITKGDHAEVDSIISDGNGTTVGVERATGGITILLRDDLKHVNDCDNHTTEGDRS